MTAELVDRFQRAVDELRGRFGGVTLDDDNADEHLRSWLDGADEPLAWSLPDRVTADEWFFVSTLYGEMTVDGQRTHIRKYFPLLFVEAARRDVRNFTPGMPEFTGLRSAWMSRRLCRMAEILRSRGLTMDGYTDHLRRLEAGATPSDPMPALDSIVRDHRASGWKTLSVFVRDCVGGNSFPIDSRVARELKRHGLPVDERLLVSLALAVGANPREIARMFYEAGGAET